MTAPSSETSLQTSSVVSAAMLGTWHETVQTDRGVPTGGTMTGGEAGLAVRELVMRSIGNMRYASFSTAIALILLT